MHALGLLERTDGPVILEDFPDDPPGWSDQPGWQPPIGPAQPASSDLAGQFAAELAKIMPVWDKAKSRYGRTSVGLSAQDPAEWPGFVAASLRGEAPVVPMHKTVALTLRYFSDDLRALYSEAAQAVGPAPASRQIDDWFWRNTVAGQVMIALRNAGITGADPEMKTVATRFLVPTIYLPADAPKP